MLAITLPPGLFCTFFAIPFGRDQPTEIWALAKLRFWFKPRRRLWDQSGVKELVTITVPKKVERVLTKGFSQNEVESRLKALANTLDTRGWAIKNVDAGAGAYASGNRYGQQSSSDRLIDIGVAPQEVPNYDVQASDDMLDVATNPLAQQFQSMIDQSSVQHRQHIMDELNAAAVSHTQQQTPPATPPPAQSNDWFTNPPVSTPQLPQKPQQPLAYSHMRTLKPLGQQATDNQAPQAKPTNTQPPQKTTQNSNATSGNDAGDPAILSLANNNDLNVSTIARQAHKANHGDEPPQDEVVVSLH